MSERRASSSVSSEMCALVGLRAASALPRLVSSINWNPGGPVTLMSSSVGFSPTSMRLMASSRYSAQRFALLGTYSKWTMPYGWARSYQ